MAAKKIITVPNQLLREKSQPIRSFGKKTKQLANDLVETMAMAEKQMAGVGLAAIQIGVKKQMFVLLKEKGKPVEIIVNPKITWASKKTITGSDKKQDLEGCLSVPDLWGVVKRAETIKIKYQDIAGRTKEEKLTGFLARVVLHEFDHLNGVLFIDRVIEQKNQLFKLERQNGQQELVEINLE